MGLCAIAPTIKFLVHSKSFLSNFPFKMPIDYHLYSKQLNIFLDEADAFKAEYADNPSMYAVAKKITDLLLSDRDLPFDDARHPFHRFWALSPIAEVIQEQVQEPSLRPYVVSFFHSGGANYEDLCDFLDKFWDWAEYSDSDSEDSGSEDSEDEDEHIPPQNNPNAVIDLTESDDDDDDDEDAQTELSEEDEEDEDEQMQPQDTFLRDHGAQLPRLQIPPASQQRWDAFFDEPVRRRLDFDNDLVASMPAYPPQLIRTSD